MEFKKSEKLKFSLFTQRILALNVLSHKTSKFRPSGSTDLLITIRLHYLAPIFPTT